MNKRCAVCSIYTQECTMPSINLAFKQIHNQQRFRLTSSIYLHHHETGCLSVWSCLLRVTTEKMLYVNFLRWTPRPSFSQCNAGLGHQITEYMTMCTWEAQSTSDFMRARQDIHKHSRNIPAIGMSCDRHTIGSHGLTARQNTRNMTQQACLRCRFKSFAICYTCRVAWPAQTLPLPGDSTNMLQ